MNFLLKLSELITKPEPESLTTIKGIFWPFWVVLQTEITEIPTFSYTYLKSANGIGYFLEYTPGFYKS